MTTRPPEPTEEQFLAHVAKHQMRVWNDDGLHRHVQFRAPDSGVHSFSLVTWPGYLAYSGDMGCYVFTRLSDMFEFFRTDRRYGTPGDKLHVNLGYWAEKCVAVDPNSGVREFSRGKFEAAVREWPTHRYDEVPPKLMKAIEDRLIQGGYSNEQEARGAVEDFEWVSDGQHYTFREFWGADVKDWTYRFRWCCFALAWGIWQYDKSKSAIAKVT